MRRLGSVRGLKTLGRERLSRHFFMRDFLYSEIGNFVGIQNIPANPDLALYTARKLATELLDPLVETFGPIAVRSAYRSAEVNGSSPSTRRPGASSRDLRYRSRHVVHRAVAAPAASNSELSQTPQKAP